MCLKDLNLKHNIGKAIDYKSDLAEGQLTIICHQNALAMFLASAFRRGINPPEHPPF
jgi:hypothetical protein